MEKVPIRLGRLCTSVQEAPPRAIASVNVRVQNVPTEGDGPQLRAVSAGRVCRVCTTNEARYTCPRCNLPYCSVNCYRTHGESCTEQFYQEHVNNEMAFNERATAAVDPKAERQRATAELITRVQQFHDETSRAFDPVDLDGSSASDDMELSAERLAQLALLDDTELSLDSLTDSDRARFLADVAGGRMSKYVIPWEPWWRMDAKVYENETSTRRRKLIIEVVGDIDNAVGIDTQADIEDEPSDRESVPAIEAARFPMAIFTRDIEQSMPPSMASLIRNAASPSPSLPFHLVEVLFAYAFTMRRFNGDWTQDPEDAARTVLHCSDVLRADARFATLEEVGIQCLERRDLDGVLATATNRLVLAEAAEMLVSDTFALDALTDLTQMLTDAADEITRTRLTGDKKKTKHARAAVRTLHAVQKKVEFYRVWRFHSGDASSGVSIALHTMLDGLAP